MQLPRFRLRTLMLAVATVGILFGVLVERRNRFLRLAEHHRSQLAGAHLFAIKNAWWSGPDPWPGPSGVWLDDRGKLLSGAQSLKKDYHRILEFKYRTAARRPWLSVPADPPPPK